jgi:HlyD family secretion protein
MKKKSGLRWVIVLGILLAAAGGAYALRGSFQSEAALDPAKLQTVERGDIARSVVATGKIQPRAKIEVKSKASGIVKRLFVEYGDWVKQGQVLAELDQEELQARVREARATIQAAEAAEEASHAALERNKVEAEGPELPFLKSARERAVRSHQEGLVAQAVAEEAERAHQLALNRQATALRNVSVSRAEVARAKAQVAQARAVLDRAEEDLRNATILSPVDALVLGRGVEVGDAVSSILVLGSQATLIFTLGDVSDVYFLGKVDQADIGRVFLGQRARIVVESFKDRRFEGQVTKISPLGVEKDNVTTFEVRVSIRNPGGELKANMSANAEMILEERKNVLLVNEAAVSYDKERAPQVEIPDSSQESGKRRVPVKLGIANGLKAAVLSGLKEGDRIVLP